MHKRVFTRLLLALSLALAMIASAAAQESVTVTTAGGFNVFPVSPGSWATAFGDFAAVGVSTETQNGVLPIPTILGGVEVLINGAAVPLNYVGPQQINFIVPFDTPVSSLTAPVSFQVRVSGLQTYTGTIGIIEASPDLFMVAGTDAAAALNQDNTPNSAENPAAPGSVVQLFAAGQGPLTSEPDSGAATPQTIPPFAATTAELEAYVQATEAVVEFSGLAANFASLWQINIRLPADLAVTEEGTIAVFVKLNGIGSDPVAIYVQP